jgi:nucleotide-binding universal stress UspA family protein
MYAGIHEIDHRSQKEAHSEGVTTTKPSRILLPIDIAKCPLEVFSYVNKFAGDSQTTITLLHVLSAMTPDTKGHEKYLSTADKHLERLASRFISANLLRHLRVRVGEPAQEILAEIKDSNADFAVLTTYKDLPLGKRPLQPGVVGKVLGVKPCAFSLLHVRTHFNCDEQWGVVEEIVAALAYVGLLRSHEP